MDPIGSYPHEGNGDQGQVLLIALVVTSVFAVSLVGAKIWARTKIAEHLGWDDLFVVLGVVSLRTSPPSTGLFSGIYLGFRYCGDSPICQGAACRPGETRPIPSTRTSRAGWVLVIYCSVHRCDLHSFRSALGCMLADAKLWDHQILEMGPAVGHYLHRDHQDIDLNPPRTGMPSPSEDLGPNA